MFPHLKKYVKRFGYEATHREYLEQKAFSYHLEKVFKLLDVTCVLDVGANIGGFRDFIRNSVGFGGLILSFEPVKSNLEILNSMAETDSNWIIYDFALGDQDGEMEINVMKSSEMCSFKNPNNLANEDFQNANTIIDKEIVQIKKLDTIFPMLQEKHKIENAYLKLDTQGYDMEVIKGAQESLRKVKALQTEISFIQLYEDMPSFSEVNQTLDVKGFDISGIYPVNRDSQLRVVDFDCVMINRNNKSKNS